MPQDNQQKPVKKTMASVLAAHFKQRASKNSRLFAPSGQSKKKSRKAKELPPDW